MRRKLFISLICFISLVVINLNCFAFSYKISDDAGLLSDEEKAELNEILNDCSKYSNVCLITTSTYSNAEDYAMKTYNINYMDQKGLIILLDTKSNEIVAYSPKGSGEVLDKSKLSSIEKSGKSKFKNGEYFESSKSMLKKSYDLLKQSSLSAPVKFICLSFESLLTGLLIIYSVFYFMTRKVNNKVEVYQNKCLVSVSNFESKVSGNHKEEIKKGKKNK